MSVKNLEILVESQNFMEPLNSKEKKIWERNRNWYRKKKEDSLD